MYKKGRVNSNSRIISTDEDPSLRIESSAIINLRGVSTKLNKYIVFTMQTYKKLIIEIYIKMSEILIFWLYSYLCKSLPMSIYIFLHNMYNYVGIVRLPTRIKTGNF